MVEIEIDGKKVEVPPGSMVMDAANKLGTYIPHFCYHKKLSIAANCRMCLVEVEKAPKPLPACATPVSAGMIVRSNSAKAGSMLGSGAVIVMDETTCMVRALERLSYFYFEESCGQCTPCREGTGWLYRVVHRIETGKGKMEDLDLLNNVADNIQGRTICALGDAAAMPVRAMIQHYRDEFAYHIEHKKCLV